MFRILPQNFWFRAQKIKVEVFFLYFFCVWSVVLVCVCGGAWCVCVGCVA